jgi:pimeloyl-ACP methyl ester carboxylesterase
MKVILAATEYGCGEPVAILHGLFGSARNWASVAQRLGARHRVIAFDLRNHGASPWAEPMDYPAMAEDVRAAMRERGLRRYALLGHSMGGKVAMIAALDEPDAVERLAVVDIAPVARPVPYLPYVQAMRALDLTAIVRRRGADTMLAAAIPDSGERAFLLHSLAFDDGTPRWQLNLAALEKAMPALGEFPARPGARYDGPALFVAAGRSDAIRPADEPAIKELFPAARIARIADAGHWVHAERPDAFLAMVERFLSGAGA